MGNNAQEIYEELEGYQKIKALIGTQEDVFIDFKLTSSSDGLLTDDDKKNFSKAASGFAHQEGGVIVWGVDARKDDDGIDQAVKVKAFGNIKKFKQALESQSKVATEPPVDGIRHKVIFVNDDKGVDKGVVVTLIPKSMDQHQAIFKGGQGGFYKRHGDGFFRLTTEETKTLFFRNVAPDLKLELKDRCSFVVKNVGGGVAKNVAVYVGFIGDAPINNWFDGEGNTNYRSGTLYGSSEPGYARMFSLKDVVHPGQSIIPFMVGLSHSKGDSILKVRYKLFAENMAPKEGVTEIKY